MQDKIIKNMKGTEPNSEYKVVYQCNGIDIGVRTVDAMLQYLPKIGTNPSKYVCCVLIRIRAEKSSNSVPSITPLQMLLPPLNWDKVDTKRASLTVMLKVDLELYTKEHLRNRALEVVRTVSEYEEIGVKNMVVAQDVFVDYIVDSVLTLLEAKGVCPVSMVGSNIIELHGVDWKSTEKPNKLH